MGVRCEDRHRRKEGLLKVEVDPRKRGFGKTVLVVDDYEPIRKLLAAAFLSDGFKTCREAANGAQAIALAREIQPDLITMDLTMPGMNGLVASSALKKFLPNVPIILLTLFANHVIEAEAVKAGISVVFHKTVPLATLIDKAHELMGDSGAG